MDITTSKALSAINMHSIRFTLKVSVVLANKYTNDFDYNVCKKIIRELEKKLRKQNSNSIFSVPTLIDMDDIVSQKRMLHH